MWYRFFLIIGAGLLLCGAYLTWQRTTPLRLSFANIPSQNSVNNSQLMPVILEIPDVDIKLPVIPANLQNREWEDTKKGVSYLKSSPVPGEKGNSIIYGHNWPNLLGRLNDVKKGSTLVIRLSDDSTRTFDVVSVLSVTPNQTHVLNQTEDNRITLYTCTGWFDSRRLIVTAVRKS